MNYIMDFLKEPWPWYIAGPIIAFVYVGLLYFGKSFGISANLRTMCSVLGAGKKITFFNFDWKSEMWNMVFVVGAVIGGFIASQWMSDHSPMQLSEATTQNLEAYGITSWQSALTPTEIFQVDQLLTARGLVVMILGGFLIGFGTRYAGGCTSGHAISGLANLQMPSLVAVIGFFVGGLIMTFLILPHILSW